MVEQIAEHIDQIRLTDSKKKYVKSFTLRSIAWPKDLELEVLSTTPIYNIDSLYRNIKRFDISMAGVGYYSVVFRLQPNSKTIFPNDFTLKLFRFNCATTPTDIAKLLKPTGRTSDEAKTIANRLCAGFRYVKDTDNLVVRQLMGHKIGNQIAPDNINLPICVWAKENDGTLEPIGYSLPFVEGEAVMIADSKRATQIANRIEEGSNVYVGNRGFGSSSCNAIITPSGTPRFIDVRIR